MASHLDNPAGRLLAFLRDISTIRPPGLRFAESIPPFMPGQDPPDFLRRGETGESPEEPDLTLGDILAITEDSDEPFQVALRLMEVRRLVKQTRDAVSDLPEEEDPEFLLRHFPKIESYIGQMTDTVMSQAARLKPSDPASSLFPYFRIDSEVMYGLEACSKALHRWKKDSGISSVQLDELVRQVRLLIDSVTDADGLGSEAKAFLVRRLQEVESALLASRITGYADLEDALDRLTGALARRRSEIQDPGLLAKIRNFFQIFVQTAQGTTAIAGATTSTVDAINTITS